MQEIIIATDISCDSSNCIATWACYIQYSGGVIKETGQFKKFVNNTPLLEMLALINALVIAKHNISYWRDSKVIAYNEIDNVFALSLTKAGNLKKKSINRSNIIIDIALPLLDEVKKYEIKKIKAHFSDWETSEDPTKYEINRWCDTESRNLLRCIRTKNEYAKILAPSFFFMYNR